MDEKAVRAARIHIDFDWNHEVDLTVFGKGGAQVIIGLTGGIATGKSTVSRMLSERGARIVDADQIAREIVLPGSPVLLQIAERFGQAVLQPDGSLHRKLLGEIIFQDPKAKKILEAIMHPVIRGIIRERMASWEREAPDRLVVADIPLLYESGLAEMFEEIMVVYVPEEIQLERLMARDNLTREQALQRIQAQMPIEEKRRLADMVIDNSRGLMETGMQVSEFWKRKGLL